MTKFCDSTESGLELGLSVLIDIRIVSNEYAYSLLKSQYISDICDRTLGLSPRAGVVKHVAHTPAQVRLRPSRPAATRRIFSNRAVSSLCRVLLSFVVRVGIVSGYHRYTASA
jgi:hypothetical protein